jgi:hypothetical protein
MKLIRTYDEKDYEKAIIVVRLHHTERQRELKHEKKLDQARSKNDKAKGKEISKPKSSTNRVDQKNPYDKGQQMIWFVILLSLRKRRSQSRKTMTRQ